MKGFLTRKKKKDKVYCLSTHGEYWSDNFFNSGIAFQFRAVLVEKENWAMTSVSQTVAVLKSSFVYVIK